MDKHNGKEKSGFTLVELLVVVAIISMLLSYVMYSFRETKSRSRDAKRESDMKQLQEGLAIYMTEKRQYPICSTKTVINGATDCISSVLMSAHAMSSVPVDPLHRGVGNCDNPVSYVYCYISDGLTYTIEYNLETDTISGKTHGQNSVKP